MIVLSSFLRRAVYPAMSKAGLFSRRMRVGEVAVLTYHGVRPEGGAAHSSPAEGTLVTAAQFRRHIRLLKSRYQLITPAEFRGWIDGASLPPRAVLLTCDDGLTSVLSEMVPILEQEKVRCLFFVTAASLREVPQTLWYEDLYAMLARAPGHTMLRWDGSSIRKDALSKKRLPAYWWSLVQQLSALKWEDRKAAMTRLAGEWSSKSEPSADQAERPEPQRLMNQSELLQLVGSGMTVGAHTISHPILARMPEDLAEFEIRESRTQLEAAIGCEIWALAYPFGSEGTAGTREMNMAERAGYRCAFMNSGGAPGQRTSLRFAFPRVHVGGDMTPAELEAHLSGFHDRLQRWFGRRKAPGVGSRACA